MRGPGTWWPRRPPRRAPVPPLATVTTLPVLPVDRAPLTLRTGRSPFEVGAAVGCALGGVWGLVVPGGTSQVLIDILPAWFVTAFYAQLFLFGVLLLGVLTIRDQETRLVFERIALYGVGYSMLSYAVAAVAASGLVAGTVACFVGSISLPAATWRIRQIHVDLARLRWSKKCPTAAYPPPVGEPHGGEG